MSVATRETSSVYRSLGDRALERELVILQRKVSALKWATTAAGMALHAEFTKRLDQVRGEVERRRT